MGMKWEYYMDSLQPITLEHWDAQSFVQFLKKHDDSDICQISSSNGEKHQITVPLPEWNEQIKSTLIKTVLAALEAAVVTAIATGSATLVITLPTWVPVAVLVLILGEMARRQIWKKHSDSKLMNIRLVCPTQELYDGLDHYFQGTWELP